MSSKANGMSTLEIDVGDIRPVSVAFTADELVVTLADGRRIATPLAWYPRLRNGSAAVRGEGKEVEPGNDDFAPYCPLSATNRNSPSAFDTSSRTDFLPSFFS